MAFTGAISGLFSCGRARRPQTRDGNGDIDGTKAGEDASRLADSSDPEPNLNLDPKSGTGATSSNSDIKKIPADDAPFLQPISEECHSRIGPLDARSSIDHAPLPATRETVAIAGSAIPRIEKAPRETPPEDHIERYKPRRFKQDTGRGTQIEHRILVSAAQADASDAEPKLSLDMVETSVVNMSEMYMTAAVNVDPTPIASAQGHLQKPEESKGFAGDVIASDAGQEAADPFKATDPKPTPHGPVDPHAEAAPTSKDVEIDLTIKLAEVVTEVGAEVGAETEVEAPVEEPAEESIEVGATEKQPSKPAPTLTSLPLEIRNLIYEHMTEDAPIRMCRHDDPALSEPPTQPTPKRNFYGLTQVSRQLRTEFLPIYEQRTKYIIDLWAQRSNLTKLNTLKGEVAMDIDAACFDMQPIDLLPLIRYLARTGRTNCRFASTEGVVFRSIESTVEQLNKLLPAHNNANWTAAVNGPMKRVDLHLFPHDDIRQYYRFRGAEPMVRIVYPSAATEGWMKQSHKCGAEYEAYLEKTGLDLLDMHVVVGHASRRTTNEGRLPLDWRLSYAGSRLSMDQAVRISGTWSR